MVRIPKGAAQDQRGNSNSASQPLAVTAYTGRSPQTIGIDTWDRSVVLTAYRQEFEREEPDWGYTGDVETCVAGTTSQAFRDSVLRRVNWYRRMAGIDSAAENPAMSAAAQQMALIILAQGESSHSPPTHWACYTDVNRRGGENLYLGTAGIAAVDGYMRDLGDKNLAVGHRRQILSPLVREIGTGDARDGEGRHGVANAMHLAYDFHLTPVVREVRGFVAWPPPGYVPPDAAWGRWSFSMQRIGREVTRVGNTTWTRLFLSGPDFSGASVAVSDDHGPVQSEIIYRDEALVWAIDGDTRSAPLPQPADGDHCYTVTISGVRVEDTVEAPYEYAVCIIDIDS